MVKQASVMVKLKVRRHWKVLPCRGADCAIRTNKRYRSPAGQVCVACCYNHADQAKRYGV